MKTVESRIAPNPMEAKIWIDLSADPHGLVKKYWNGEQWVIKGGNGVSKEEVIKEVEVKLDELKKSFSDQMNYFSKAIKDLTNRISKLEQYIITE